MTATAQAPIKLSIPKPHPAQAKIMDAEGRFNVVVCGRRFGKTRMALLRSLKPILSGKPIAYFAPTYKMLTEFWREAVELYKPVITEQNKAEHWFKVMGGGSFQMWSLDSADTVRGRKYALALIDEAAMVPNLQDAWQAVIRPTLTDYEGGADFYSTPKGLNFFYTLFCKGQEEGGEWQSFQMPTSANPFIKQSEIDSAAIDLPQDVFKQEYLAEFIQGEGAVFRNILANLYDGKDTPDDHRGHSIVAGGDWGRVNDFTAISVVCESCKRELELDRFNQIDWELQRGRLISIINRWGVCFFLGENNSIGDPIIEALQKDPRLKGCKVVPFQTTAQSKPPLVLSLALALEQEELKWLNVPIATRELESYEATREPNTGRIKYTAPEGFHDDTVIARCLAREAMEMRKRSAWTVTTRIIR